MALSLNQKKEAILTVYPNWRLRVEQMPENQIVAIYHNMLQRGAFNRKPRKMEPKITYRQMTIFDYMEA